jgi:hypothetical protein
MKEIDIKMTSVEVNTGVRALRVEWTREMVYDLLKFDINRKRKKSISKIFLLENNDSESEY